MHDKITKLKPCGPPRVYFYRHGRRKWNGKAILHYAWPERKRGAEDRKKSSTSSSGTTDKRMLLNLVCICMCMFYDLYCGMRKNTICNCMQIILLLLIITLTVLL